MTSENAPDDALATAARDGSAAALGELYRHHADAIFATAYRLTASEADADDVLQDVFVGLPEALRKYEPRGQFGAWLPRVAVRVALMKLRAERRRREDTIESADLVTRPAPADVDRIAARDAIAALPESLRTVFMLKEIEGYSHEEIAALLKITRGASTARLFRAWEFLSRRTRTSR